jgi:hypothetical protein
LSFRIHSNEHATVTTTSHTIIPIHCRASDSLLFDIDTGVDCLELTPALIYNATSQS